MEHDWRLMHVPLKTSKTWREDSNFKPATNECRLNVYLSHSLAKERERESCLSRSWEGRGLSWNSFVAPSLGYFISIYDDN